MAMQRTNPDLDIILDIIKALLHVRPDWIFIKSLEQQYCERGSLSKKQLEGLHSAAVKISGIHPGKLATLQAIILKKPTKYRSSLPQQMPAEVKDNNLKEMIENILGKYPQHKRVLFLKAKFDNNEIMGVAEIAELEKFHKLLA